MRTIKGYYNNTLNFLIYAEKHHGITEVEEICTLHIKHYVQYLLSKKLTATYTNNILKCLRAFFRFAIQEEYIYSNPALKVKMQKEPKVLIKTFNDDEVRTLLSVFDYSTFLSARNKMVLAIAFDTGARNTEICEIKREDIRENVILLHGKGNKERNVPISSYLRKVIQITGTGTHSGATPATTPRKYMCPCCGMSVRATKTVNITCMDCTEQ